MSGATLVGGLGAGPLGKSITKPGAKEKRKGRLQVELRKAKRDRNNRRELHRAEQHRQTLFEGRSGTPSILEDINDGVNAVLSKARAEKFGGFGL